MPIDLFPYFRPGATESRLPKSGMKEKALTTTNYVAVESTLQEIQSEGPMQMNFLPREMIAKSL